MTDPEVKVEGHDAPLLGLAAADDQLTEYSHSPSLPSDHDVPIKQEHVKSQETTESYSDIEMLAERQTPRKPEPLPPRKLLRRAAKTKRNRDAYVASSYTIAEWRDKANAEAKGRTYKKKPKRKPRNRSPEPASSDSSDQHRPSTPTPRIRLRVGQKSPKTPGTIHSFESPSGPISPSSSALSLFREQAPQMDLNRVLICLRTISQTDGRVFVKETFLTAPLTTQSFLDAFAKQLPPGHLTETLHEIALKIECHGPDFTYATNMLLPTRLLSSLETDANSVFRQKIQDVSQVAMMKGMQTIYLEPDV